MTTYIYFFSYHYQRDDLAYGFGMCEALWDKQIISFAQIKETANTIKNRYGLNEVVILNYQLIDKKDGQ